MLGQGPKRRPATETKQCPYCGNSFNVRGYGRHEQACRSRQGQGSTPAFNADDAIHSLIENDQVQISECPPEEVGGGASGSRDEPADVSGSGSNTNSPPSDSYVRIEYHPNSKRDPCILRPEEFKMPLSDNKDPTAPLEGQPWRPFRSQEDFEFAELTHAAALNKHQIDTLIKLIKRCERNPGSFTFEGAKDVEQSWEDASKLLTPFTQHEIKLEFEDEMHTFDTWSRPLWAWLLDHLVDPDVVRHFEWDAQKVSRHTEEGSTRIYTEPWTGNRFWKIQSSLPEDAKMLCLELYADKTRLSSFGTEKGYPVMARIANLPAKIRNGEGIGGSRVVGWLPVVDDTPEDKGKPAWVNFKRVVWHKAFYKLVESIEEYSKAGCWVKCGDGVERHIYPLILMLVADYEEQSIMSLIRGVNSLFPCPRCLIPANQQGDRSAHAPARTSANMQAVVQDARQQRLVKDKEEILKSTGLRDVDNVFWKIRHSDPYMALSFDRLHTFPGGIFRHHLWPRLQKYIESLGREASVMVNAIADSVPPWRELNHFKNYIDEDFMDGSKWEDISKICVPVMRNVFAGSENDGKLLLRCVRAYVELDMLASFDLHTDQTITFGRAVLDRFVKLANECEPGAWNFPKMHLAQHLFDDIEEKGVTRNYTSKTFEKMHGPVKESYKRRTNFKNVGGQILKADHRAWISAFIRYQITQLDKVEDSATELMGNAINNAMGPSQLTSTPPPEVEPSFTLGSKQSKPLVIGDLQRANSPSFDRAFTSFRSRVSHAIQALSIKPTNAIHDSQEIIEFRFLKVDYESKVDWCTKTDYLRCNPAFHGNERRDFVLVDHPLHGQVFGRLVLLFTCRVDSYDYPLALVQMLERDSRDAETRRVDKSLSIYRWHMRPRNQCEVIPLRRIIRGSLLVADPKYKGDYFVIDTIDNDMYLRVMGMNR